MLKRLYHFAYRFKEALLWASIILTTFVGMVAFFYPGDEGIEAYIGIFDESFLGAILGEGIEAGGFLFWVSMQISIYIYYILTITAIRMGARIMPTTREDGVELTVGANSLSSRRFYIENLVSAMFVLALSIVPSYIVLMISVANQEGDNSVILERLGTTYLFAYVVAIGYMAIASAISVFFFRKDWGVKAGLFYLIYSFIIELVAGSGMMDDFLKGYFDTIKDTTGYDMSGFDIGNISLNAYIDPAGGLLSGDFDWIPVFVVLGISAFLFLIAIWKVKSREYIEVAPKTGSGRQLFNPESKLAQKFPIVFEQLRRDIGSLIGWFLFTTAMAFLVPSLLPSEEEFSGLLAGFDMPMFRAFAGGNELRFDYTGFIALEFYGITFMYFGMFMMFAAISIPTSETRNQNQDIVWGNNISQSKIIFQRTLTLLGEVSVLIWASYGMMRIAEGLRGVEIDTTAQLQAFVLIWLQYMMLTLVLVALAMIRIPSKSRAIAMWFYILMYMFIIFGYSAEALSFLVDLSIYSYNDVIGVLYGIADFNLQFKWAAIDLGIGVIIFLGVLNFRFKKNDII